MKTGEELQVNLSDMIGLADVILSSENKEFSQSLVNVMRQLRELDRNTENGFERSQAEGWSLVQKIATKLGKHCDGADKYYTND
jgi:hypothetical protein